MCVLWILRRCPRKVARGRRAQRADVLKWCADDDVGDDVQPESHDPTNAVPVTLLVASLVEELDHLVEKALAKGARIEQQESEKDPFAECAAADVHAGSSRFRRAMAMTSFSRRSSRLSTRRPNGVIL